MSSGQTKGTIRWLSPELLRPPCRSSIRSDIYAYAGVCYEIFTGNTPFHELTDAAVIVAVLLEKKHPSRPENLPELADSMWEIMESCWEHEAHLRPTADYVLSRVSTTRSSKTGVAVGLQSAPDWNSLNLMQISKNAEHPSVDTTTLVRLLQKKQTQMDVSPSPSLNTSMIEAKPSSTSNGRGDRPSTAVPEFNASSSSSGGAPDGRVAMIPPKTKRVFDA
ncbi:hypothetical protein V5O48_008852 [Marasmius crinis-equi]|uniref:Protein kinase domain-containing protein n=1 Tax=Marasmius crinis-equi TaxID=585013 RepID=A0ABR3FCR0_9AGAR